MPFQSRSPVFESTPWTLLHALRTDDAKGRRNAMERLAESYWPPVYAFLRRSGMQRDDAADVTQAFFTQVVLRRKLLEKADEHRGRLRTYLLSALQRFRIDAHRRARTRGQERMLPVGALDQEEALVRDDGTAGAAESFDRRWAMVVLEQALRRAEAHYRSVGRHEQWRVFEARVLLPAIGSVAPVPLPDLVNTTDFGSPAAITAAVSEVRKRIRALAKQIVAETTDPDLCEEETRYVLSLLR